MIEGALTESMAAIKAATDYGSEEVDDLEAEIDEIKALQRIISSKFHHSTRHCNFVSSSIRVCRKSNGS